MDTGRTVVVTGATGNQGGAVVRNLISEGFHVKAITRNASSARALQLKELNADVIEGNLDDPSTYSHHLKGADGVFCVLIFAKGIEREIKQGIALSNLAKNNGVKHFIYSSVVGADRHTDIPHWESKFKIETHIKETGLEYTIIRPASFYENFLIPQVRSRLLKGKLVTPAHRDKVQQYISVEDIGKISASIFKDPAKYAGRTITIAAEQMDGMQVAAVFSKVWGREMKYQQLPGFITRLAMGKNLYKMFRWLNNNDAVFIKSLDDIKKEFHDLLTLEDWVRDYFR